ncbi:MAG: type I-C CRISPR-associated protein Cas7/Csd2 [Lachnospiraceae bacterium]|uniref:type I-C CRISPR-associated protein Cas7/Csd2 n=1 Tax=Blautia sp. OF03-15BH TaxID=2292287 RepID=UPI000E502B39|nr:type I-C CRISPR-associated protein Cas7/Csd2 [Blautia sp. OF03-15BH]
MIMAINNRYDFVMLFDVENGNPNGDPDAGNAPRVDAESGYGYVTDVCLKRKIRNYVELVKEGEEGYNILIKPDRSLNAKFTEAYKELGLTSTKKDSREKKADDMVKARDYMCKNYFDVRTFGAVMSTGDNPCGIVRGPVQINFARSISPVEPQDIAITRQARTTDERTETGDTEIGRKSFIPYALYRAEGYISAALANKVTDLSEEDVELLWTAIMNMFENDHSAARGKMCMRKLFVFKHDNVLGVCPSHLLFDKIQVKECEDVNVIRSIKDYDITVDREMPEGVELIEKL